MEAFAGSRGNEGVTWDQERVRRGWLVAMFTGCWTDQASSAFTVLLTETDGQLGG